MYSLSNYFLCYQKPPELDAPLFDTNGEKMEKEAKYIDNGQEDMSVF
jgi:hypothetical protein